MSTADHMVYGEGVASAHVVGLIDARYAAGFAGGGGRGIDHVSSHLLHLLSLFVQYSFREIFKLLY